MNRSLYMTLLWLITTIVSSWASLNIPAERVAELAEEFERAIPGSVQWLYNWAREESIIDQLNMVVEGSLNRSTLPSSDFMIESVAFYLFSINPNIGIDEYSQNMYRIVGPSRVTPASISRQYNIVKTTASVPYWFYSILSSCRAENIPREHIMVNLIHGIDRVRSMGRIRDGDYRFPKHNRRIRGLVYIWLYYGLASGTDTVSPSVFDSDTGEFVLTLETQQEVFRRLAIIAFK